MADKERIYVVMTVARQIQGDYTFIRAAGAFKRASKADELVKKIAKDFVDENGKAKTVSVSTPQGNAICFCEVGAFELELEGENNATTAT